jgi:hypothetical protein
MLTTLTELAQPIGKVGGGTPGFSMTPPSIGFGIVQLGNSKVDSVTITNPGTDTLLILTASTDDLEFSVLPTADTISPGGSAKFYITFTPTTFGSKVGNGIFIHNAADSPDSLQVTGIGSAVTIMLTNVVSSGWNMISAPLVDEDMRKTTLFPTAISEAFTYQGSYTYEDTVIPLKGYFLKFPSDQPINMIGYEQTNGIVPISQGWNMIGSLSVPIPISSITSEPPGIITSQFFGFDNYGYRNEDTIMPFKGYWLKVSSAGTLILYAAQTAEVIAKGTIKIVPTSEQPPSAPEGNIASELAIPKEYGLEQAYPNPFNPTTTIKYQLPSDSKVCLKVYNPLGQVIYVLVDETQTASYKSIEWNAAVIASGVYFYQLEATSLSDPSKSFKQVKKMLLVK